MTHTSQPVTTNQTFKPVKYDALQEYECVITKDTSMNPNNENLQSPKALENLNYAMAKQKQHNMIQKDKQMIPYQR